MGILNVIISVPLALDLHYANAYNLAKVITPNPYNSIKKEIIPDPYINNKIPQSQGT